MELVKNLRYYKQLITKMPFGKSTRNPDEKNLDKRIKYLNSFLKIRPIAVVE